MSYFGSTGSKRRSGAPTSLLRYIEVGGHVTVVSFGGSTERGAPAISLQPPKPVNQHRQMEKVVI